MFSSHCVSQNFIDMKVDSCGWMDTDVWLEVIYVRKRAQEKNSALKFSSVSTGRSTPNWTDGVFVSDQLLVPDVSGLLSLSTITCFHHRMNHLVKANQEKNADINIYEYIYLRNQTCPVNLLKLCLN